MNEIYNQLLQVINYDREAFDKVVYADNPSGIGINSNDLIEYLEFSINEDYLNHEIKTKVIITNGDVYTTLKIIHDLAFEKGIYILYINDNNVSTNYYFVSMVNKIYEKLNINVNINIDMRKNYNDYLNEEVTIIGSSNFVREAKKDFTKANVIII